MNQFEKFNDNLYSLLNPIFFQPARFVNRKYGKKYTRSDYEMDKTMGCRGTAFYLFGTLSNHIGCLNDSLPRRDELDKYIEKYDLCSPSKTINTDIPLSNKSICVVSMFANVFERYYVPWHTFVIIRFDNPSGNNFKIMQSWNDGETFVSVNELSSGWISNPEETILSIIRYRDIESWHQLFGHKTTLNIKENDFSRFIKFKFNFQLLIDDIDLSWYSV